MHICFFSSWGLVQSTANYKLYSSIIVDEMSHSQEEKSLDGETRDEVSSRWSYSWHVSVSIFSCKGITLTANCGSGGH